MGNLASLTEVKEFLQIPPTVTTSDSLLNMYITMTEAELDAVTDRNLALTSYTETLDYLQSKFDRSAQTYLEAHDDAPKLFLKQYPVVSLTLIQGGNTVTSSSYSVNNANGVISSDYQMSKPTASYTAGYTTATAPEELKAVVKMGVMALYTNYKPAVQGSGNVRSKRIKDFSVDYGNAQTSMVYESASQGLIKTYLASNMHILKRFKRRNI